jgi:hypothetical protein
MLKGNSGITANNAAYGSSLTAGTGNWLGTINSADLILAANNKEGLRVNTAQQVLIGTTTVPTGGTTAKVIIDNGTTNGALQIKDGTEGDGKVLTSDANGVAKWTTLGDLSTATWHSVTSPPITSATARKNTQKYTIYVTWRLWANGYTGWWYANINGRRAQEIQIISTAQALTNMFIVPPGATYWFDCGSGSSMVVDTVYELY